MGGRTESFDAFCSEGFETHLVCGVAHKVDFLGNPTDEVCLVCCPLFYYVLCFFLKSC